MVFLVFFHSLNTLVSHYYYDKASHARDSVNTAQVFGRNQDLCGRGHV